MKTKHANKLLVLIISIMMIATLFVVMSITANAEEAGATTTYTPPTAGQAKIYGAAVNLGGDISMKYYVEIGEGVDINNVRMRNVFLGLERTIVVDGEYSEEMENLAKALYNYGLSAHIVVGNHEGGNAPTCAEQSICTICGNGYGELLEHNYTYIADDDANTITASCDKGCGCSSVVKLEAPANLVYNGNTQNATVSGEIKDQVITVTYEGDKTPINTGSYTASISVGDASVSVTYTIEKATPTYEVSTNLTAIYGQTLANVALPEGFTCQDATTTEFEGEWEKIPTSTEE